MNFLKSGGEVLSDQPGFKLVGRDADLRRLSSILMRSKAASVLLIGPGGVGITALCMGLQASKSDPDAPFDIVNKRLFWLDTDGLFSSGNTDEINKAFQTILTILKNTSDSILIVEDTRDFIEGARNAGVGHFIAALNSLVKNGETQVILEAKDDDLDFVLKAHSDMKECYTMIDLSEPLGEALLAIANNSAKQLTDHHRIAISDDAITTAIELTNKYRTRDLSLSRAQPERTVNLLDRSLATYRLDSHKRNPEAAELEVVYLNSAGDVATEVQAEIIRLDQEFEKNQVKIKEFFRLARDGELAIIHLNESIEDQMEKEKKARSEADADKAETRASISKFSALVAGAGLESEAIRALRAQIKQYQDIVDANRKAFDDLTAEINKSLFLTKEHVLAEFSRISGIPANKLNEDEKVKLRFLEDNMKKRIFGQDEAVKRLADAVKIARIGRRNGNKPQAAFMFMGPSGVGKTEIAKALAQNLLDDEAALTRFDMSEYAEKHAVAKLIGAPPGYEGFEVGGILTNEMRKNPRRIILFDEIEKAHPDMFDIFLQILSDGRLSDNVGRVVSFSDTIILMTTNIGQTFLLDPNLSEEDAVMLAKKELDEKYKAEFLNRFAGRENIICFKRLQLDSIEKIVTREVKNLSDAYVDSGIKTVLNQENLTKFCADNYDPKIGARGLPGIIGSRLEPIIANMILENSGLTGTLNVIYDMDNHRFDTELVAG